MRDLSAAHWQTLAILDAVSGEVSLDVLERLSPLEPQDVHALVRRSVSAGIVTETKNRGLILSPGVSLTVKRRLSRINTKKRLASIAARVQRLDPKDGLTADARISLLLKAGLDYDAALLAQEEAEKCVREGNASDALGFLERRTGSPPGGWAMPSGTCCSFSLSMSCAASRSMRPGTFGGFPLSWSRKGRWPSAWET